MVAKLQQGELNNGIRKIICIFFFLTVSKENTVLFWPFSNDRYKNPYKKTDLSSGKLICNIAGPLFILKSQRVQHANISSLLMRRLMSLVPLPRFSQSSAYMHGQP